MLLILRLEFFKSQKKKGKVDEVRKRKADRLEDDGESDIVRHHYINYINDTMNQINKFFWMKDFYLAMGNAPIHTSN